MTMAELAAIYRTFADGLRQYPPAEIKTQSQTAAGVLDAQSKQIEAGKLPTGENGMGSTPEERQAMTDVFHWFGTHCP
jgi:hypothetical protein